MIRDEYNFGLTERPLDSSLHWPNRTTIRPISVTYSNYINFILIHKSLDYPNSSIKLLGKGNIVIVISFSVLIMTKQ